MTQKIRRPAQADRCEQPRHQLAEHGGQLSAKIGRWDSADGKTVTGWGPNPNGDLEGYTAVLEVRPAQLLNISTRMRVLTGDKVLIGGLIITGTEPKKVISDLRSPGAGALQDTTLEVYNGNGALLASNDDWKVRADGTSQEAEINAITIPPADNRESAVAITLVPGNYTAVVRGKGGTTGVSLIQLYHLQ